MKEGDTLEELNFKFTAEVKLEGGLNFIFTALEAMSDGESHLLPYKLGRRSHGEEPIPFIGARFLYFDRVDEDINMFAIRDQVVGAKPDNISASIKLWFRYYMGQGLSNQDVELCADKFCSGIGELCSEINAKTPESGSRNIHFYTYREGLQKEQGLKFYYNMGVVGADRRITYKKVGWLRPGEKPILVSSARCCECAICWLELPVGGIAIQLDCSHYFHLHCIVRWINMAQSCPLCRFHVCGSDFYFRFPYSSYLLQSVEPYQRIEKDDDTLICHCNKM